MKNTKNVVVIDLHEDKIINGSTFYAFEYFMCLNKEVHDTSRLVIHIPNYTDEKKTALITSLQSKYKCNIHAVFCKRKTDVFKYMMKADSVLFVDIYSFMSFKDVKIKKFTFSNEFYKSDFDKLSDNVKNSTSFYGWYDYQYHSKGCRTSLKINFDIFKPLHQCKYIMPYIHLTEPVIDDRRVLQLKDELCLDEYLIKDPNIPIGNLFAKISEIIYVQNSDVIDKNNRTLLEAQHYGIGVEFFDFYSTQRTKDSINRLLSRDCEDFTLTRSDKLIQDVLNYEKGSYE